MHRFVGQLTRFRRRLALGVAVASFATSGPIFLNQDNMLAESPGQLAYNPESVETAKRLWIGVDTPEPLASCYTNVLRDAGVLAGRIDTNADLAAAHESMTAQQQEELDSCRRRAEDETRQKRLIWA